MKKVIILSALALLIGGLVSNWTADTVESKGHVSVKKVQVCHDGDSPETITVSQNALQAHLDHGDCQLPACDFANVFLTGDDCSIVNAGGDCGELNPRDSAEGETPACPVGTF